MGMLDIADVDKWKVVQKKIYMKNADEAKPILNIRNIDALTNASMYRSWTMLNVGKKIKKWSKPSVSESRQYSTKTST